MLRQIHDDLDSVVFAAYGWPETLTDEEILERLVALNAERAEEERQGLVRWLRPEFQNSIHNGGGREAATQTTLAGVEEEEPASTPTPAGAWAWARVAERSPALGDVLLA